MSSAGQSAPDVTYERLEDQLGWYDRKASQNQKLYRRLKICTLVFAALIPAMAGASRPVITGLLGVLLVIIEGVQQVYQYHANWIAYRATCEALKHEKYLYLALAGPYAAASNPRALLAERIESLVSQEHARWASGEEKSDQKGSKGTGA